MCIDHVAKVNESPSSALLETIICEKAAINEVREMVKKEMLKNAKTSPYLLM